MTETIELHHSVDAKHAQNIGEQSVSDRVQAIIEIVKNSYDADALICTVRFFGREPGVAGGDLKPGTLDPHIEKIVISDDGIGMTRDDIENKWMRLATDSKLKDNVSPKFGRRVSGQKGMGHFATQKLGSKIVIISNPEMHKGRPKSDDYNKMFMLSTDWDTYTPGKSFDEIVNPLVIEPRNDELNQKLYACKHGLTIEITNLREEWTRDDVEKVQLHLGALQIPKFLRDTEENVFHAEVKTEGFDIDALREMDMDITDYAPWTFQAHLRGDTINWQIKELDYKTLKKIPAKETSNSTIKPTGPQANQQVKALCGDADLHIYYYPGKAGLAASNINDVSDLTKGWIPQKIVRQKARIAALQQSSAGIKIFHDKIRIRPYGDPRDPKQFENAAKKDITSPVADWLGLDERRFTRGFSSLGGDQVIGYVLLTREKNPDIMETTTRQALVENDAFKSLRKDFVLESISILEKYVQERKAAIAAAKKKENPAAKAMNETKQLEEFIDDLPLNDADKKEAKDQVGKIDKHISDMNKQSEESTEKFLSKLDMYRNLSSLGISALAFHHEIMQPLGRMEQRLTLLKNRWDEWDDEKKIGYIQKTLQDCSTIMDFNSYIKQFASLFSGTEGARKKRVETNPRNEIEDLKVGFQKLLTQYNIKFSVAQGGGSFDDIWIHRSSFQSIVLNLIGNSINTLQNVSREEKWIKVTIEKQYGHLIMKVSDNGFGIREDGWDRIFEPHYTKKKLGTGMGLTIVEEILKEDYDGTIKVEKSVSEEVSPGAGETTFVISIPLQSLRENTD